MQEVFLLTLRLHRHVVQLTRYASYCLSLNLDDATDACRPGILMQIGDAGGAYFTGAIAIHTFNTLVLRNKLPAWTCLAASIWGWLFAVLLG